jgi:thiol:disulfide interchange protein DsbD
MLLRLIAALAFVAIAAFAPRASAQADADGLLPVDQAFRVSASATSREAIDVRFAIADGYYLYQHRIKVTTPTAGITIASVDLSAGEAKTDEFLGDVVVWYADDDAHAAVRLGAVDPALERIQLQVGLQGCHANEPRICYPPDRRLIEVALPPAAVQTSTALPAVAADPLGLLAPPGGATALGALAPATPVAGAVDDLPLPPEQAFRFEAIASAADGGLLVRFTMPPGYYLYRDKTRFTGKADPPVRLGTPRWPPGVSHEDAHFGRMVVYFDTVEIPVPVGGDDPARPRELELTASFQGCQAEGICYPPMTRTLRVGLPSLTFNVNDVAGPAPPTQQVGPAAEPISEQDRYARSIRDDSLASVLSLFFVVGLGLAFTPCVFPMVPILSGILAGAGQVSTARATWLSTVYVLATAVVFTVVGVIAGMAGENLQAILQKPAVLVAFAGLFVFLALSMFGFYELQVPGWLQTRITALSNKQNGGSTLGVAVMGVLSALLVGPCVAPPLAGAVVYISQQQDPVLGGAALFAMAMGMGAPLIAFGASAGRLLPRAGAWMDTIKAVFGVAFLFLALWMLERVLDPVWIMLGAGMLLVAVGVHMGALDRLPEGASGWRRTWKAVGFVLLALGMIQFIGAASGGRDYLRPLAALRAGDGAAAPRQAEFRYLRTTAELDAAIRDANAAGKAVLFDFYADWCVECKRMERTTFADPAVLDRIDDLVTLKVDVTDQTDADKALQQRFNIIGPPATLFFGCDGNELAALRLVGYEAPAGFAERLSRVASC